MINNNLEEATSNVELTKEKEFRNYLISILLQGRSRYLEELKNYYVSFKDLGPGHVAAVDPDERIVFIKKDIADKLMDPTVSEKDKLFYKDYISMLIRHELLHSILKHSLRTITYVATRLGYDPSAMSPEEFDNVMQKIRKPSLLYRNYNGGTGIKLSNGAGDYELSKWYIERDAELQDIFGGLLLEDNPEWAGYSFELLMTALLELEKAIMRKFFKRAFGDTSNRKNFKLTREEPSIYSSATTIEPDMIKGARLLLVAEYLALQKLGSSASCQSGLYWLMDLPNPDLNSYLKDNYSSQEFPVSDRLAFYVDYYDELLMTDVDNIFNIVPVLDVPDLDLYENLTPGKLVDCLGETFMVLPTKTGLIAYYWSIDRCKFNILTRNNKASNYYRHSIIKNEVDDWFETKMARYK